MPKNISIPADAQKVFSVDPSVTIHGLTEQDAAGEYLAIVVDSDEGSTTQMTLGDALRLAAARAESRANAGIDQQPAEASSKARLQYAPDGTIVAVHDVMGSDGQPLS